MEEGKIQPPEINRNSLLPLLECARAVFFTTVAEYANGSTKEQGGGPLK
jgi:hypothetical protein